MIRTTFRWLVILLGLLAVAGGAAAWYAWVRSDAIVRGELEARLGQIAPSCALEIGKVRFDWDRSITVRDFAVRAKGKDAPPTLVVPEVVIGIDRERFVKDQAIDVQVITLVRPRFDVTRRADGTWSVEDLAPFHLDPSIPVPEWKIEDATVRFRLEQENAEPVVLTLQEANLRLVPAGRRQLVIRGLSDVADAGPLKVSGNLNLEPGRVTWSLSGSVEGLNTSGNIAGFALRSSANLREQVAELGRKLRHAEETLLAEETPLLDEELVPEVVPNNPFRTASRDAGSPAPWEPRAAEAPVAEAIGTAGGRGVAGTAEPCDLTGLGLNAVIDLQFAIGKPDPQRGPTYQVTLDCRDGQIVNPLLPFGLQNLRGRLYWDNGQLRLTEVRADGRGTALLLDGQFGLDAAEPSGRVKVAVTDLVVSDRYPGRLPPAVEKFLQIVRPRGPIDVDGTFQRDESGGWVAEAFKLTAKGASVVPTPFAYPIQEITGTLEQTEPGRLEANMTGKAGAHPVSLCAVVENAGPEAVVGIEINADRAVVDERLRDAFKPDIRAILDRLNLEGTAENLSVKLFRPAGLGQKFFWRLTTKVRDGELEYEGFPYRIKQLKGELLYDSETETLTLSNVQGTHGDRTSLEMAQGTYRKPPSHAASPMPGTPPFGLTLPIVARRVTLGDDLKAAVGPTLKGVWEDLQPGGLADLTVQVRWLPGGAPDIRLPELKITNGRLRVRAFPYPLDTVAASLTYVPGRLEISDFVGWHDVTRVTAKQGLFTLDASDAWTLTLPDLDAGDVTLDADLLRALPVAVRAAIEKLALRGSGAESPVKRLRGSLELGGSRRSPAITARWNLGAELSGATAEVGVDVTDAVGIVTCAGRSEGEQVDLAGTIGLQSARVFGQKLADVKGPYAYRDGQVEIGTRAALAGGLDSPGEPAGVPMDRRLTAHCLGDGVATLDALVTLGEQPRYLGRATLTGGRLEYFGQGGGMRDLSGVTNGWVNFWNGSSGPAGLAGRGRLRVEPAALYQLPVFMQMFKALTTIAPAGSLDNTAFRSAQADFRIRDQGFEAYQPDGAIVLTGDSLRLVGGGRVEFDGRLRLEFYTTPPRNAARILPLIGPVLNAAATGWISVVVEGTTDQPRVRTVPLKVLDNGWRQMLEALGPPPARTAGRR